MGSSAAALGLSVASMLMAGRAYSVDLLLLGGETCPSITA